MLDYEEDYVYDFEYNATYICEDGDVEFESRNYFFDDDMERVNFTMRCQDNGNWTDYPNITCQHKKGM